MMPCEAGTTTDQVRHAGEGQSTTPASTSTRALRLVLGVVAVIATASCSSGASQSAASTNPGQGSVTSPTGASAAKLGAQQCVLLAQPMVYTMLLPKVRPGDAVDDAKTNAAWNDYVQRYGADSKQVAAVNRSVTDEHVLQVLRASGASAATTASLSVRQRECAGAAIVEVAQTVPSAGSTAPADLSTAGCNRTLQYWGPLVAKDPANAARIAAAVYSGTAYAVQNNAVISLGEQPDVSTDLQNAISSACMGHPF